MFDETAKVFARPADLEKIGLRVPQVTKIMTMLHEDGYPVEKGVLTVEQALRQLLPLLQEKEGRA